MIIGQTPPSQYNKNENKVFLVAAAIKIPIYTVCCFLCVRLRHPKRNFRDHMTPTYYGWWLQKIQSQTSMSFTISYNFLTCFNTHTFLDLLNRFSRKSKSSAYFYKAFNIYFVIFIFFFFVIYLLVKYSLHNTINLCVHLITEDVLCYDYISQRDILIYRFKAYAWNSRTAWDKGTFTQ